LAESKVKKGKEDRGRFGGKSSGMQRKRKGKVSEDLPSVLYSGVGRRDFDSV